MMKYIILALLLAGALTNYWLTYDDYHVGLFRHCNNSKCVNIYDKDFLVLDNTLKIRFIIVAVLLALSIITLGKNALMACCGLSLLALLVYFFGVYRYKYFPSTPKLSYSFYAVLIGYLLAVYLAYRESK